MYFRLQRTVSQEGRYVLIGGIISLLIGIVVMIFAGFCMVTNKAVTGTFHGSGAKGDSNAMVQAGGALGLLGIGLVPLMLGLFLISFRSGKTSAETPLSTIPTGPPMPVATTPAATGTASATASPAANPRPSSTREASSSPVLGPPPYSLRSTSGLVQVVIESARVAKGTGLLTYRVRVENGSTQTLNLQAENTLAVDVGNSSYTVVDDPNSRIYHASAFGGVQAGQTVLGDITLSSVLPPSDTGTDLQLRIGFGGGFGQDVTSWTFDTLVPRAA